MARLGGDDAEPHREGERIMAGRSSHLVITIMACPFPNLTSRPDLAEPVLYWVPVIAPGNLMFYRSTQTFPQWNGSGFIRRFMRPRLLNRIIFDGQWWRQNRRALGCGSPHPCDVEQGS